MDNISSILIQMTQAIGFIIIAPLIQGIIKKAKACLQRRRGPRLIQSYLDIIKLLRRESVVSHNTSWITSITPYIYLAVYVVVSGLIPFTNKPGLLVGDIIVILYLFALARFFLALAALESGSAFGGMGSSREMMITTLVEPVLALGLFALVAASGNTELNVLLGAGKNAEGILAFIGLMIVTIAETGRIPVDNPDTHLELTMVHEGMLLEYAGRQLGFLHLGAMIKQAVMLLLILQLFLPTSTNLPLWQFIAYLAVKVSVLAILLAIIESITAKMRLFRLPELMAAGAAFCLLSLFLTSL